MTKNNWLLIVMLAGCALVLGGIKAAQSLGNRRPSIVLSEPAVHPYCTAVGNGALAFGKDYDIDVRLTVADGTQGSINSGVESLYTLGYKAFSIYPADPAGSKGLFGRLKDNKAMVVAYGAQPLPGTATHFAVATDTKLAAVTAAEKLAEMLGRQGKVLNVLESLQDANTKLRREGVEEVIAKYPGMQIVQTVGDVTTPEAAREKMEGVLVARGFDVDGIICTGYTTTVAAANLLTEHHKKAGAKRIRFVGLDDDKVVLEAIRNGSIDMTLAQNPFAHGYISSALLKLMMEGRTPKAEYQFIDSGFIVVTKGNLETFSKEIEGQTREQAKTLAGKYFQPAKVGG